MKFLSILVLLLLSLPVLSANVLFDESHRQAFSVSRTGELDLSNFGQVIEAAGHTLISNQQPFSDSSLNNIDAVILSGPFQALSSEEMVAIRNFVINGGKLSVMIHISPTVGQLLSSFNINVSNFVVNESNNILNGKSNSFVVKDLKPHPIFNGISEFNLYGGWALKAMDDSVSAIANSSDKAWLDLNKNQIPDGGDLRLKADLVVTAKLGQGEIIVFADDAIFQNRFLTGNNKKLAENLAKWLTRSFI